SPEDNAAVIVDVLSGRGTPAARAAVLLNAGAALYVAGTADTFDDGIAAATRALDRGDGMRALERLRAVYAS
ncbi:MAG: hypothetical protein JO180_05110, partial [Gemmatirosa sp.]|nr:hypothetical protein [Gemmatirosa sp.]